MRLKDRMDVRKVAERLLFEVNEWISVFTRECKMNQNKGSGLFALLPSRWSVFHLVYIHVEVDLSARLVAAQPEGVPEVGLPSLVIPVAQNRQHT